MWSTETLLTSQIFLVTVCATTETFFSLVALIIFLIDIMPPTQLVNAGIEGPLTNDFDFNAHIIIPPAIDRYELLLAVRIAQNFNIENFNNNSILDTVNVKTAPTPRPDDLDIGPALKAPLCYSPQELQDLVESQRYSDSVGPLPPSLTHEVELGRAEIKRSAELERQAGKEKEKESEMKT